MNDREHDGPSSGARERGVEPIPQSYLPEPRPSAADAYWDGYARRVVTALEPVLSAREAPNAEAVEPSQGRSWTAELGDRWGATALLAAAAVAAVLAVGIGERGAEPAIPSTDDVALALIAADGDPALLWDRLGIPADPVLAWLTFDGAQR